MGSQAADPRPLSDRRLGRGRRERAAEGRREATHVDVELVLAPNEGGVGDERDLVALRRPSTRALEERSRAPGGFEIGGRSRRE